MPSPRTPKIPKIKSATQPTSLPAVVLVGRVNVGKSSLFNRLTEGQRALVSKEPGTTRDRQEGVVEWGHGVFRLVDTGGVESFQKTSSPDDLAALIAEQTARAIEGASLTLLVVSAEDGVLPQDLAWAEQLRGKKGVLLIVNKVDNTKRELNMAEFYALGLGDPIPVSAVSGRRSGDLLDEINANLKKVKVKKQRAVKQPVRPALSLALIGQPNSGKSSLLNALLGEQRVIMSPQPRTTREPIDTYVQYGTTPMLIIDTAGIRRKAHVTRGIEAQGVAASLATIERADVVLFLLDIVRGPTLQDQRLAHLVIDAGKGVILVVNKWDLIAEKSPTTINETERSLRRALPGLEWAPMVFVSAKTGQRVTSALDAALAAQAARGLVLEEETLREFLKAVVKQHRPSRGGGVQHPHILSLKQVGTHPPHFEIVTRGELHPSYLKFLENRLRDTFGFVGTPIQISLRALKKKIVKR